VPAYRPSAGDAKIQLQLIELEVMRQWLFVVGLRPDDLFSIRFSRNPAPMRQYAGTPRHRFLSPLHAFPQAPVSTCPGLSSNSSNLCEAYRNSSAGAANKSGAHAQKTIQNSGYAIFQGGLISGLIA
jgi:hypothetical protein